MTDNTATATYENGYGWDLMNDDESLEMIELGWVRATWIAHVLSAEIRPAFDFVAHARAIGM